jgi:hypothetical protein
MTANQPGNPPKDADKSGGPHDKPTENVLEKSLEDTFPASDPPSSGSPAKAVGWDAPEEGEKK